jgi:hypothetical protein
MPTIKKYQEDPYRNFLAKTSSAESGGNPNVKASTSSALGKYQFLEGTWKAVVDKYDLGYSLEDRRDPKKSEEVMRLFTKDNEQQLKPILGRELTDSERYLGHFLGVGGAGNLFKANKQDPDMPVNYYLSPKVIEANRRVFYNKDGTIKTTKQIYDWADKKMSVEPTFAKDVAPYMNMQSNTISILPETEINTTFVIPQVEIDYLNQLEQQAQVPQQTEITPQEDTFMQDLLAEISKGVEYVKPVQRDIMQSGGKIQIKDSEIEGRGVFTQDGFNKGDFIGLAHTNGQPSTKLGEFHNHSYKPNAESVLLGNDRFLVAKRKLKPNEEITVDYTKQPELEQPSDFSLYQQGGENINNENKFLAELKQLNLI